MTSGANLLEILGDKLVLLIIHWFTFAAVVQNFLAKYVAISRRYAHSPHITYLGSVQREQIIGDSKSIMV